MNTYKSQFNLLFVLMFLLSSAHALARQESQLVTNEQGVDRFPLVDKEAVPIWIDAGEEEGVILAAQNFQQDVKAVTGIEPELFKSEDAPDDSFVVIIGTLGTGGLVDEMVASGRLKVAGVAGKWETFLVETLEHPFPGVEEALVIAGSDKRGTIFGIYEMSEQIGVSPWYWWADVPIKQSKRLFVKKRRFSLGSPSVKYRGIFINDEAPALSGWTHEKFGGFNHQFYEKVYELILRLKGNFLPVFHAKLFLCPLSGICWKPFCWPSIGGPGIIQKKANRQLHGLDVPDIDNPDLIDSMFVGEVHLLPYSGNWIGI